MSLSRLICLLALLGATAHALPPANDAFTFRQSLGNTASTSVSGDNTDATLEAGESTLGGIAGETVWYEWTAPATGFVNVKCVVNSADTVLAVYTGTAVNALTLIAFNDDAQEADVGQSPYMSNLTFHALSGTSYKIAVASFDDGFVVPTTGPFQLALAYSTTPVQITALSITPDPANVTNASAACTLNLSASTTLPGAVSMLVRLTSATDSTRSLDLTVGDAQRVSGTAASGTYQLAFFMPRYIVAGDWTAEVRVSDGNRDTIWSYGGDLIEDDFTLPLAADPVLAVTNTGQVDLAAPVLTALTATPATVNAGNTSEAARVVTFAFTLTDNLSGVSGGTIQLVAAGASVNDPGIRFDFSFTHRVAGDAFNGDYQFNAAVPYGTDAGAYAIRVIARDFSLAQGSYSNVVGSSDAPLPALADSQITVTGTDGYPAWAATQSFATGLFAPGQDADGDGALNIAEYAFGTNPSQSDVTPVTAGTGTSGGPLITLQSGVLRIEYVRRKASTNSGLAYTAQFCSDVSSWADATATPTVTSIDATWERVVIADTLVNPATRFGRVRVVYTQP